MRAREHASAISQCGHALCGAPRRAMKRRRAVRRGIVRRCATRRTVFVTIAAVAIVFVVRVSQTHSPQRGCRGRRSRTARARISRRFGAHVLSRKRLDALCRVRAVARSRAVTTKAARARVGRRRSVAHVAARQGHHARGAAARRRRRRPERSQPSARRAHCGAPGAPARRRRVRPFARRAGGCCVECVYKAQHRLRRRDSLHAALRYARAAAVLARLVLCSLLLRLLGRRGCGRRRRGHCVGLCDQ